MTELPYWYDESSSLIHILLCSECFISKALNSCTWPSYHNLCCKRVSQVQPSEQHTLHHVCQSVCLYSCLSVPQCGPGWVFCLQRDWSLHPRSCRGEYGMHGGVHRTYLITGPHPAQPVLSVYLGRGVWWGGWPNQDLWWLLSNRCVLSSSGLHQWLQPYEWT